jgi:hypothetical protein
VILKCFLELHDDEEMRKILQTQMKNTNFVCLRLLVSLSFLFPLQSDLSLKRFFVQMSSTLVKPLILDLLEEQDPLALEMLQSMAYKSFEDSLIFSIGLKGVIRQAVL